MDAASAIIGIFDFSLKIGKLVINYGKSIKNMNKTIQEISKTTAEIEKWLHDVVGEHEERLNAYLETSSALRSALSKGGDLVKYRDTMELMLEDMLKYSPLSLEEKGDFKRRMRVMGKRGIAKGKWPSVEKKLRGLESELKELFGRIKSASSDTTLCFCGLPGAGKTFIATAIIDDLSHKIEAIGNGNAKTGLAFLYFSSDISKENQSARRLLGHILRQLMLNLPDDGNENSPYPLVKALYDRNMRSNLSVKSSMPETSDLIEKLENVIDWYDRVYLNDREHYKIKILTTSTPTFAQSKLVCIDDTKQLSLEIRANDEDIKIYAESMIPALKSSLVKCDAGDVHKFIEVVTREANGLGSSKWAPLPYREMARYCIDQLCLPDLSSGPLPGVTWYRLGPLERLLQDRPLLRYVSSNWVHHVSTGVWEKFERAEDARKWLEARLKETLVDNANNVLSAFQVLLVKARNPFPAGVAVMHNVCYVGEPEFLAVLRRSNRQDHDRACDEDGKTALHWAILCQDSKKAADMVKVLLKDFVGNINATDADGRTPLHYAALVGETETTKPLLVHGAKAEVGKRRQQITPRMTACFCGLDKVVVELLINNANVNAQSEQMGTPLKAAFMAASEECSDGALQQAATGTSAPIVKLLLDAGFNANCLAGTPAVTPLQGVVAVSHPWLQPGSNVDIVRLLLDHGEKTTARFPDGSTILDVAVSNGYGDVAQLLRERGATNSRGWGLGSRRLSSTASMQAAAAVDLHEAESGYAGGVMRSMLDSQLQLFVAAVTMGHDSMMEEYLVMVLTAFKWTIQKRQGPSLRALCDVSVTAFKKVVELARNDQDGSDENGDDQPLSSAANTPAHSQRLQMLVRPALAGATAVLSLLTGWETPSAEEMNDRNRQAASSASGKLERVTQTAVEILLMAASDPMMEVLVKCLVKDFEDLFKASDLIKAKKQAIIGIELLASATRQRYTQLAYNLAAIWALAARNVCCKGFIVHDGMSVFMFNLEATFLASQVLPTGRHEMERFGTACVEILAAMVADPHGIPDIIHSMATVFVEGWVTTDTAQPSILRHAVAGWGVTREHLFLRTRTLVAAMFGILYATIRGAHSIVQEHIADFAVFTIDQARLQEERAVYNQILGFIETLRSTYASATGISQVFNVVLEKARSRGSTIVAEMLQTQLALL
ncbi:ankyrin repeat protein [Grosmannia clavigera kw1407]|uniref:Ankyrin repeat protein n=1 Tax=Grosmannia clavigera (strain kw1407 / UAMH 11150) TaxID=655863 RepID=F0XEF9_GROCL|nr:ankyrin repeat protein [Grosmannia clavigera kw1407]EFX03603.1 ankyrin repeat protein [Grosmannia clavigera kw1407]